VGECFFWYRPTRVVPDQRPLNGRCCCCCRMPSCRPTNSVKALKANLISFTSPNITMVYQLGTSAYSARPSAIISVCAVLGRCRHRRHSSNSDITATLRLATSTADTFNASLLCLIKVQIMAACHSGNNYDSSLYQPTHGTFINAATLTSLSVNRSPQPGCHFVL